MAGGTEASPERMRRDPPTACSRGACVRLYQRRRVARHQDASQRETDDQAATRRGAPHGEPRPLRRVRLAYPDADLHGGADAIAHQEIVRHQLSPALQTQHRRDERAEREVQDGTPPRPQ